MSPLFVKYKTDSGNCYVYDVGTNEIVQIGVTLYALLDDFLVLNADELIAKNKCVGATAITQALTELHRLQSRGILCDHLPMIFQRVRRVKCEDTEEAFDEFLMRRRRLLVLELTQKCNLKCEYCCYGHHYPQLSRSRGAVLSFDMAKNVVKDFIDHRPQRCSIGFYGGEPLLEFELLKQIVLFATEYASHYGMEPDFSMTTNGTLLTDERIHFLVTHRFKLLISFDGPKNTHDRYRVLRNEQCPDERSGSYDVVVRNLRRFVELYPRYYTRGFATTITAMSDLAAIDEELSALRSSYPLVITSFVRDVTDGTQETSASAPTQIPSFTACPCEGGACMREGTITNDGVSDARKTNLQCGSPVLAIGTAPEFCNWTKKWFDQYRSSYSQLKAELFQESDPGVLRSKRPVSCSLFTGRMKRAHDRPVSNRPSRIDFGYRCYPGATRTFCSASGELYPCERTQTGDLFKLGDADTDIDVSRTLKLTERVRLLSDCGNCVAKRLCNLCLATVQEVNDSGSPDSLAFQQDCRAQVANCRAALREYTSLMEESSDAVENMLNSSASDDWLDKVRFIPTEEQRRDVELGVEEIEEDA